MLPLTRLANVLAVVALFVVLVAPAAADSPARTRELTCSDGTTFTGEQVRHGGGRPPRTWRNVSPGAVPAAFTFHATTVTAPDGTVVESESWNTTQGVAHHHDLVTCWFIIPIGPLAGHRVDFEGFFVPGTGSR